MEEVRNIDGKLVCRINEAEGTLEIKIKDCITVIKIKPDDKIEIKNYKNIVSK